MSLSSKNVSLTFSGNPLHITRKRKNSNDTTERVNSAIHLLNEISTNRPEWKIDTKKKTTKSNRHQMELVTCSVCVSDISESEGRYTTGCGHSFHLECIIPWFTKSTCCPNCREQDLRNPLGI